MFWWFLQRETTLYLKKLKNSLDYINSILKTVKIISSFRLLTFKNYQL